MCIVCGSGTAHLFGALARSGRGGRFVAEAVAPDRVPPLDPADAADLAGPADTILRGGPILTLAAAQGPAEAIAVRAGRIQAIGPAEDVLALRGRLTRVIDLQGRALLPGFVNAHWHMNLGLLCEWLDLPAEATEAAICTAVAAAARGAAAGEWILLRGPARPPDAAALDAAAPDHPVLVTDAAGAILFGNAAASVEPLPARVADLLPRVASRLGVSTDPLRRRLARLLQQAAAAGTTCLRVCGLGLLTGTRDLDLLRAAVGINPALRLRATLDASLWPEWQARRVPPGAGDDMLRVDTISALLGTEHLDAQLATAHAAGWRVTLHADAADGGVAAALAVLARAGVAADAASGIEARRPPTPAERAALQEAGLSLGLTIDAAARPSDAAAADLSGLSVSLGFDAAAGPSSPLRMLAAATDGTYGARFDTAGALAALTDAAARRCGAGGLIGRLERGAHADFAFLDRDPRGLDAAGLAALRCCGAWVSGIETVRV